MFKYIGFVFLAIASFSSTYGNEQTLPEDRLNEGETAVVEVKEMIRDVPSEFLSVALSPNIINDGTFSGIVSSKKFLTLTQGLSPAVLRMGGSAANFLTLDPDSVTGSEVPASEDIKSVKSDSSKFYVPTNTILSREIVHGNERQKPCGFDINDQEIYSRADFENFTITAEDWTNLTNFADAAGMTLLFDVNQFYRTPDGEWDSSNARMFFDDALDRDKNIIWQLGNEPNSYNYNYGYNFTGTLDALDFKKFHQELSKVFPEPYIVGPDVTRPKFKPSSRDVINREEICRDSTQFLEEFLSNLEVNLTALSWHHYYVDGHTSTVEDFISLETLDVLSWQIPLVVGLRDRFIPNTPVWLTETSSAFGGGAEGLSNRYVAGFLWLDKLGMAAALGVDIVARQTLFGKRYALIDAEYNPFPDYWLSLAYKQLVGERVLNLTKTEGPETLRLYVHCQRSSSISFEPGNVVVYGVNVGNTTATVRVSGVHSNHTIEQYLLEPMDDGLVAREVMLNGEMLLMTSEEELPELTPLPLPLQEFQVPPVSFGFWVIKQAHVEECL